MKTKKAYTTQEKIAYFRERLKSLEAKLRSETFEQRTEDRLNDLQNRIELTVRQLAEAVEQLQKKEEP